MLLVASYLELAHSDLIVSVLLQTQNHHTENEIYKPNRPTS